MINTTNISVDLRKFAREIRKFPEGKTIAILVNSLLDAATIVSDIKFARELFRVSLYIINSYDRNYSANSQQEGIVLIPIALLDSAIIRFARGAHTKGNRNPIKIREFLSEKSKITYDDVIRIRNKYLSHSTGERLGDLKVESTVVWKISHSNSGINVNTRMPEYHTRPIFNEEFGNLLDEALIITRNERKRRNDLLLDKICCLPERSPIWDKLRSVPFKPEDFFPTLEQADLYRQRGDEKQDGVDFNLYWKEI